MWWRCDPQRNKHIDRAWRFYEHRVYTPEYIAEHGLFDQIQEVYNPVPKIVFIMTALTLQQTILPEAAGDVTAIEQFWQFNRFQSLKYELLIWLILAKSVVVELIKTDDNAVGIVLHDPRNVELKYDARSQLVYAKITGQTEIWDERQRVFRQIRVTKEYYNVQGYRVVKETIDKQSYERPLAFDFIPVVEFTTDYNLWPLFDKIDAYNELTAFLKAIFYIHGDPIIYDTLTGRQLTSEAKDQLRSSRGKALKILHLGPDGMIGYLEMQGNIAKLMLEEKNTIHEHVINDYPEYVLAQLLSKGDPSGEALKVKAIEIESKVKSLRNDLEEELILMNNMALQMMGLGPIEHRIKFGGILPTDLSELSEIIAKLRGLSMITRRTGMMQFPEIIPDVDRELADIKEEEAEIRLQIAEEFSEHVNTQDTE